MSARTFSRIRVSRAARLLALAASVAPLALIGAADATRADGANGQNGTGGSWWTNTPGTGGNAGLSGDGFSTGTAGGGGGSSPSGGATQSGSSGASDRGGGGGGGVGNAYGGGGGGAGGVGLVISTTTDVTSTLKGGQGGDGGRGSANPNLPSTVGGGGGGGGGGSGIIVKDASSDVTVTVQSGVSVTGGQGGFGGSSYDASNHPEHNGRGGTGGNGITALETPGNVTTIVNSGTISGGKGGRSWTFDGPSPGAGGIGIVGSSVTIVNNAGGTIAGNYNMDYLIIGGARSQAIYITGGTNSIDNEGTITGKIELAGGTTTVSGAYSDVLQVNGGATLTVSTAAGDATGFSNLSNFGAVAIGDGSTLSAATINNSGTISVGAGATLQGIGNTLNNNSTINVGAGGIVQDAGDINNNGGGIINFNGPTGTATLSSGTDTINNDGQIKVLGGDVDVDGGNVTNRNSGTVSLTGGDMFGVGTFTNSGTATLNVGAGYTLGVGTFSFVGGSVTGTGTIQVSTAFNLSGTGTIGASLTGAAALTMNGSGVTVLTGTNTYTGGTTVSAGTLKAGSAGAFLTNTAYTVNGGTLDLNGYSLTMSSLSGTGGTVALGTANLIVNQTSDTTYAGAIIGSGNVTKDGAGMLVLTGASTYTGGTTVSAGTLAGGAANAFSVASAFTVDATLDLGGFDQEIGSLSGSGTVTNSGASDATLTAGGNNTSTAFGGTIEDGATNKTALAKAGTGKLTLTGANTYTGGTTVSSGTLQLGTSGVGGVTGTIVGTVTIGANGLLAVQNADTSGITSIANSGYVNFSNTTSAGSVAITNDGMFFFSNDSTAAAATFTNNEVLSFTGASTAGTAHIDNRDALYFYDDGNADAATIANSGTVNFGDDSKAGSATITNTGVVNFDGDSTADDATIVTESGAGRFVHFLGASSAGTADITNNAGMDFFGTSTAGSATITNNASANLDFYEDSSAGSAVITNYGALTFNERVLTGAISTADNATITTNNGGSVKFYGNADGGTARFITNAGGTFDISNATTGTTTGSIEGAGTYYLGSKTLTVGGNDRSSTVSGTIADGGANGGTGGSLVKTGNGKFTLAGTSTYTGTTTVSGGTLAGGATNAFSAASAFTVNATLDLGGFDQQIGSLSGSGTVTNGGTADATLTAGSDNTSTGFSGIIKDGATNKTALTKTGSGTLTLSGTNTYTGGTTIAGGTLVVSSDANLGNSSGGLTFNGGTLKLGASFDLADTRDVTLNAGGGIIDSNAFSATIGGDITGAGGLTKTGAGTLTLAGDSSYSGNTTVNGGTLEITGTVADATGYIGKLAGSNGEVVVAGDGASWTNSADLYVGYDGAGSLTIADGAAVSNVYGYVGFQSGSGTVMVTGEGSTWTNIYGLYVGTGGTGELTIADGGAVSSLGGEIGYFAGSSGTVMVTGEGSTWTNRGELKVGDFGNGALTVQDGGTVSAAAVQIAVNSGAIGTLNIGAAAGNTAAGAGTLGTDTVAFGAGTGKIVFNHTETNYAFASSVSGNGSLEQIAGTTILTGINTYTGATTVSGGTLLVNGSITSDVTVDAGATIGGTGTLGNTTVNGTLSAGNSPGTLTVDGDLTLGSTSTSRFELGAPGTIGGPANDLVYVTGDLTLGGTLQIAGPGLSGYYRLFDVDGTISGSYTTVPTDATVQTAIPHQVNLFIQNGDQIVQFWDGADSAGNGAVDGGAGTWSAAGTNWTGAPGSANFNDQWHGEVGVFAGTGGIVTVSGPVAFEGLQFSTTGYTIAGGDLAMTGNASDPQGNAAASFVTVEGGVTAVIASALTGSGIGLDKHGSGTLILAGANTYTGLTTIADGTLQIGDGGSSGSIDGNVVDDATLAFNRSDTYTYAGDISGTGTIQQAGTGTTVLTGGISHTGGTTVSQGKLQLGNAGTAGSIDGVLTVAANGTLDVVNADTSGITNITNSGTTNFHNGTAGTATITNNAGGTVEFLNNSTAGDAVITNNTLNSYLGFVDNSSSGSATINNAGTLSFQNTSTAGSAVIANNYFASFFDDSTAGNATITANGTVWFHEDSSADNAAITINAGGLAFFDDNSTAGDAEIVNNSSLWFFHDGTAGNATITNNALGTVEFYGASTAGSATITNNRVMSFSENSTADSAAITNNGYIVFANASTAANADIVNSSGGQLVFGSASTAANADITTNGLLNFYQDSTAGTAIIANEAGGTVQFFGDSTADDADIANSDKLRFKERSTADNATITTENGGTTLFLDTSSGGNAHFITEAGGAVDISGLTSAGTTAASIEGAGNYFLGSKELTVGGDNASTTVSGIIADGGAISGTGGSLVKIGTGTLTLTGANTHTGGTTISDGTLQIGDGHGTGSILGDVLNNATLAFNRSGTLQLDGVISGTGDVEQNGAGTTILTGTSTYIGATTVSAGTLLVNGSIALSSGVTVDAGATIGGSGTLSDTVVNGTLSAGNSPGTLTVDGDLTLGATSTSLFQLAGPGVSGGSSNDLVDVTGDLTLGGTLDTGSAVSGYYRLFNVDGTTSGAFDTVASDATVLTNIDHQVNLLLQNGGQLVQFWDGADAAGNGAVDGGDGTWDAAATNWTGVPGSDVNDQWHGHVGVFAGTAGMVTVSGPIAFEGLQFSTDGYMIAGGDLTMSGDSAGNASASFVNVDGGVTAEIASVLTGAAGIGLDKLGGGTLTLTGVNTYTGATTIEAGTLALAGNGSIAASSVVAVNGGAFDISGATLPFVSINTLAGASGGTVQLGTNGLAIMNGSTEFAGTIEGNGGLEIAGGTQTLSGINTYANATQIDAGATLALKDRGSIEGSAYVGLSRTGTLDISQTTDGASVAGLFSLTGDGTVALGSKTLTITDGSLFGGSIRDGGIGGGTGGNLVIASGASQELSGANLFTGTTTIEAGGALQLTGDGSLFSSSGIVANGVFDISGQNTGSGPGIKSLTGSGELYLGDRDLTIVSADGTFDGVISDCGSTGTECIAGSTGGSLVLAGGTLTLSGVNTYTGGTVVGYISFPTATLVVMNDEAVGTGRVLLDSTGVFQAGADGLTFDNNFAVSSSFGTVDTNGFTMTISGVVADATDPGTLHKTGAGTLILANDNTYGDGTVVEAGTLQLGDGGTAGSIPGDVSVGGILAFDRSDTYTFAGTISDDGANAGQVVQQGTGVLELTGTNTYSGGTSFNYGVVAVASDDNLGDASGGLTFDGGRLRYDAAFDLADTRPVTLNAGGGTFDTNGFTTTLASDITGSGGLTKDGAGVLVLSGDNSYTGQTTVSEGTLRAGTADTFSSGSAFAVSGGATLDLGGFDQAIASLSGAGEVALGNGDLTVHQAVDTEFSGALSGGGTFIKEGVGKLMLSGVSTYTGQTFVNGGILSVNGDISSSSLLTVGPGGTIGGGGVLPSTVVDGGTLAPGNSIGTVTVSGTATFVAGSTYAVEVDSNSADRTDISGTADLSGGTVAASYAAASYIQKNYTILTAQGGRGGTTFAALTGTAPAGFTQSLAYDGTAAYLVLDLEMRGGGDPGNPGGGDPGGGEPGGGDPGGGGDPDGGSIYDNLNRNQRSVANAIVGYFDANGGIPAEFAALDPNGLTQVSGEPTAGAITAGIESADQFLGLISDQSLAGSGGVFSGSADGTAPAAYVAESTKANSGQFAALGMETSRAVDAVEHVFQSRWRSWGAAYGGSLSVDGDRVAGSHDTEASTFGLAGGISRRWGDTLVGLALGGGYSSFDVSDELGEGRANTFNAGVFARQAFGEAYVAGAAAYGFYDTRISRSVLGDTLSGDFGAHSLSGRIEAGYGIATPIVTLTPYAAFQAIAYHLPSYSETGTGSFALAYESDTLTATRTEFGARLDRAIVLDSGAMLTLSGRTALAINAGDDIDFTAGFQSLPGTTFAIEGAQPDRYSALVDTAAEYRTPSGLFGALAFHGEFSGNVTSFGGKATIGFNW